MVSHRRVQPRPPPGPSAENLINTLIGALSRPDSAVTVPMSDHHTAGPLRHHADKNVTVPTKPGSQIGILGDGFVRKMSAGQQSDQWLV